MKMELIKREETIKALVNEAKIIDGKRFEEPNLQHVFDFGGIIRSMPTVQAVPIEAVLDILEKEGHKWGNNYCDWVDAIEEIKNLPSVNPQEPKTGHWIIYDVHGHKACKCSECGIDAGYPCNDKYCPNCGAKMESEG